MLFNLFPYGRLIDVGTYPQMRMIGCLCCCEPPCVGGSFTHPL